MDEADQLHFSEPTKLPRDMVSVPDSGRSCFSGSIWRLPRLYEIPFVLSLYRIPKAMMPVYGISISVVIIPITNQGALTRHFLMAQRTERKKETNFTVDWACAPWTFKLLPQGTRTFSYNDVAREIALVLGLWVWG